MKRCWHKSGRAVAFDAAPSTANQWQVIGSGRETARLSRSPASSGPIRHAGCFRSGVPCRMTPVPDTRGDVGQPGRKAPARTPPVGGHLTAARTYHAGPVRRSGTDDSDRSRHTGQDPFVVIVGGALIAVGLELASQEIPLELEPLPI